MKSTLKIALVIALFSTATFADGDMTSGGKSCQGTCLVGDQNGIVKTIDETVISSDLLTAVKQFFAGIFR